MSTQDTGCRDIVLIHGLWNDAKDLGGLDQAVSRPRVRRPRAEPARPRRRARALRRDPSRVPDVSVEQIVDHYEGVIRGLARPPIVIGHSFGGGFTQVLLDRGLGAAAVVLGSAPSKGILRLPFTTIHSLWGILKNPRNRNRAVPFTEGQFRYAFGNTLSEEESRRAWERYAVPGVGRVVFEGALSNLNSSSPFKVDYAKTDRAPLLFIAEGERQRRAGRPEPLKCREVHEGESGGSRRVQGVPGALALHARRARLGGRSPTTRSSGRSPTHAERSAHLG